MAFQGDSIFWVEVEKIVPNPFQPRREFDEAKLKELSESIRMYGILQPLTVTRKEITNDEGAFRTEYELIAGERRLRASKLANLVQVPVIIRDGEDTEQEKLELAIIENLQREDLNAVDRAMAFQQLADAFDLSHTEVAKKVGRSREYVSNSIRLLGLPEHMLQSLKAAEISEGHARTLLMLKDRVEEQDVVYREILLKKLSVREVERIVRKIATDKVRKQKWKDTDPTLIAYEKELTDTLGTRVQISKTDYGGKLTIDYFSEEDLQKLLEQLKSQEGNADEDAGSEPVVRSMGDALKAMVAATPLAAVVPESKPEESTEEYTDVPATSEMEVVPDPTEQTDVVDAAQDQFTSEVPTASPTEVSAAPGMSEAVADTIESVLERGEVATSVGSEPVDTRTPAAEVSSAEPAEPASVVLDQISELAEYEANNVPETPLTEEINEPAEPGEVTEDDDSDDLYSMRNFSL